jgi:hypothetical protein
MRTIKLMSGLRGGAVLPWRATQGDALTARHDCKSPCRGFGWLITESMDNCLKLVRTMLLALAGLLGFGFCIFHARAEPLPPEFTGLPYPAWTDAAYVHDNSWTTTIYWVDEETVMFAAYPERPTPENLHFGGPTVRSRPGDSLKPNLLIWKVRKEPAQIYSRGSWDSGGIYCVYDGIVVLGGSPPTQDPKNGRKILHQLWGPLGHEQEHAVPVNEDDFGPRPSNGRPQTDDVDCGALKPRTDQKMQGRGWIVDATGQFYLDFGLQELPGSRAFDQSDHQIALMRADGSTRVELPIKLQVLTAACTHSHRFLGSFLVWDCNSDINRQAEWRASGCWPIWRVWLPDGRTEKICLPSGAWVGGYIELLPTKIGIFFSAIVPVRNELDPGQSGLYRLEDGSARRVLPGILTKSVVSLSGCEIAFDYSPTYEGLRITPSILGSVRRGGPGRPQVTVIDVCSEKSNIKKGDK